MKRGYKIRRRQFPLSQHCSGKRHYRVFQEAEHSRFSIEFSPEFWHASSVVRSRVRGMVDDVT